MRAPAEELPGRRVCLDLRSKLRVVGRVVAVWNLPSGEPVSIDLEVDGRTVVVPWRAVEVLEVDTVVEDRRAS